MDIEPGKLTASRKQKICPKHLAVAFGGRISPEICRLLPRCFALLRPIDNTVNKA
jgi:hypothetical protein